MLLDHTLVAELHRVWIEDQNHPHRGRAKLDIPDVQRLYAVTDVLFRASLIPEEGQHIRASVSMLSPARLREYEMQRNRSSELLLQFNEPKPFDPFVLAKLGAITNDNSCSLLVDWFETAPKIWAVIFYKRGLQPLQSIPAGMEEGRHGPPDCPTLSISGIGSIVVTRGDSVIGRIERGEFRRAVPTAFHSRAMGLALYELFGWKVRVERGRYLSDDDHIPLDALGYLLSEVNPHDHGAAVVFVPERSLSVARANADFPWACHGDLELPRVFNARIKHLKAAKSDPGTGMLMVVKAQEIVTERVKSLARLALLDGALLLTEKYDVIGFGARLRAPNWTGDIVEGRDAFGGGGKPFDFSRLGTRHTSARDFVGCVPGAIAFVASSDGPIRGIVKTSATVLSCWPDCRNSMFA